MRNSSPTGLARLLAGAVVLLATAAVPAHSQSFWETKPASEWTLDEALEVLQDSDWAHEEDVLVTRWRGAMTEQMTPMERVQQRVFGSWASYLIRWESAKPVQQAFDRLVGLGAPTSAEFQAPAPELPGDHYVVTVKGTRLPATGYDVLQRMKGGELLLVAELRTRRGVVKPARVVRSGVGAAAALHFYFPQELDGEPLLGLDVEEVEFRVKFEGFDLHSKLRVQPRWLL